VLHVGCGHAGPERLHAVFRSDKSWDEVRLDIDPRVGPDIVCSSTDMRAFVSDGTFDAVWSSHNIEHLYDHELDSALKEFHRILKPSGFALIRCPDLDAVCEAVLTHGLETVVYTAASGPVTPLDMLYGFRPSIARANTFMSHRTGLNDMRLGRLLIAAGFGEVRTLKQQYDLWALATVDGEVMRSLLPQLAAHGLLFSDN
jgi:SAM-dependent methyltransferase